MVYHWPKELLIWHCTVNYDYIVTNSINPLLIGSRRIHTITIVEPIGPILQNVLKALIDSKKVDR